MNREPTLDVRPPSQTIAFAAPLLGDEEFAASDTVLRSGWIASGPNVIALEKELSAYFGNRPTRVLTSETAALEVALQLLGIGSGDEVLIGAQTFFSSGNMVEKVGAKSVFVDVDLKSRNIDLADATRRLTSRTRAIIPTHYAGLACDMDALYAFARQHNVRVIEDAALAVGSSWRGKAIGSFGDIALFSFHPNKNITTIEGGALVCNDVADAKRVEVLRFHGISRLPDQTRDVDFPGGKFNMPDVNAAIGRAQLKKLDRFSARRRQLAHRYLANLGGVLPDELLPHRGHAGDEAGHSWNLFAIRLPLERIRATRPQIMESLRARMIATSVSYESPHLTTLFRSQGWKPGDLPNTELIANTTLTLPLHAGLSEADVDYVSAALASVLKEVDFR
ncbi:MAG: DegT/DnrJ/EryC1/StrS aminotransferase family protein [Burkholderiales bacterium]|nr:DegT/DnrJ/EryC1/StrS aminotransferase family protein [Burkholderiales bacterium]